MNVIPLQVVSVYWGLTDEQQMTQTLKCVQALSHDLICLYTFIWKWFGRLKAVTKACPQPKILLSSNLDLSYLTEKTGINCIITANHWEMPCSGWYILLYAWGKREEMFFPLVFGHATMFACCVQIFFYNLRFTFGDSGVNTEFSEAWHVIVKRKEIYRALFCMGKPRFFLCSLN